MQEQEPEAIVDLPALQAEYPDIKGWITIPEPAWTTLSCKAAQMIPNTTCGAPIKGNGAQPAAFLFQWDCTPESRNTVVYGHNMNDGTMFAVLQKMADAAFREEHSEILLQTETGLQEYTIVAVLKTDISKLSFNRTVFADDGDFLSFQKELLAQPLYHDPAFIPGADHRLLTLVTCSYEWDNAPHGGCRCTKVR